MIAIEIGVLANRCLDRRIPDLATLVSEANARTSGPQAGGRGGEMDVRDHGEHIARQRAGHSAWWARSSVTSSTKPPCWRRASDRTRFNTPDDAAKALLAALETNNTAELKAIFGPNAEQDLSSGDPVSDRHDRQVIALAMRQSWKWVPSGTDRSELVIGDEQWPLPIPLVKAGSGWEFDTDAGKDEMLSRRIGRNELRVIDLCRAYVLMQQEYASQPRDCEGGSRAERVQPGRGLGRGEGAVTVGKGPDRNVASSGRGGARRQILATSSKVTAG